MGEGPNAFVSVVVVELSMTVDGDQSWAMRYLLLEVTKALMPEPYGSNA